MTTYNLRSPTVHPEERTRIRNALRDKICQYREEIEPVNNNIELLVSAKENHYFDRKSARKDAAEIARHIIAFANAAGGRLAVGIEDDGTITGFKRDGAHSVEDFEQIPITLCLPTPIVATNRVAVVNSKGEDDFVLVMDVACSTEHVIKRRTDGKVALREGASSVWLDHEQIKALEYDKGQPYFEDGIAPDSSIDDIDEEALAIYAEAVGAATSGEKLLRSRHFMKGDNLTNAGLLLFAQEPSFILPQARVRVLKIDGTKMGTGAKMNIIKDKTFDGPLIKAVPEARSFIASQLRDFQFQGADARFTTVPEYPEFAWFEGLVNAMAHRDYSIRGEYTRVYLYTDRLEIQSPGKLPNIVRLDNLRATRYSRNPKIARAFTEFEWVRELNEGVDKIYEVMKATGLPEPEYSEPNGFAVKLVLRNNIEARIPRLQIADSVTPQDVSNVGNNVGNREHLASIDKVLYELQEDAKASAQKIADQLDLSKRQVERLLRQLREEGRIRRTGGTRGVWEVVEHRQKSEEPSKHSEEEVWLL